jgi:hypothetical protein
MVIVSVQVPDGPGGNLFNASAALTQRHVMAVTRAAIVHLFMLHPSVVNNGGDWWLG